jgi:hypothetical protein
VGENVQHTNICYRGYFGLPSTLTDGSTLDPCYEIWDYFANNYRGATNCLSIPVVRWLLLCDLTSKVTSDLELIHDCYLDDVGVKLDSCMRGVSRDNVCNL